MALNDEQLNKILNELCQFEPQLRGEEEVLRGLIKEIASSEPEMTADGQFKHNLRARLVKIAAERERKQGRFVWGWGAAHFARPFAFAAAVIALIAVIALPFLEQESKEEGEGIFDLEAPAEGLKIEQRGAAEFGTSGLEVDELVEKTATSGDVFDSDIPSVQPAGE